jgi:hypothetical protein
MMDIKDKRIIIGIIVFIIAAWLIVPFLCSTRKPAMTLSRTPLTFDASNAYRNTRDFVTQFPFRVLGTLESRQSTGFLQYFLEDQGYQVSYNHFEGNIGKRKEVVGRNVKGFLPGSNPEILALVAHLDTARTTFQGAMDNGAAVGVLLELARALAATPTRRSILIIFTDGGEWGMLGANDAAEHYPERDKIAAVLSLDHVSIGELGTFCLQEDGQQKGFSPPWLREIAFQAAKAQGLPVRAVSGIEEHLQRSFLISRADHGPFLRAGIPAITLGSESADRERARSIYHSPQDTIENVKISSIEEFGQTAERIIRTIDEAPSIPKESSGFFRLWNNRYLRPNVIQLLHIISFLPLLAILWVSVKKYRSQLSFEKIGRELIAFLATLLPFWVIYFAIGLFRVLNQIPIYSIYPAAQKDPILINPPWNIIGAIIGSALFVAVACFVIATYSLQNFTRPDFNAAKLILLFLSLIVVGTGLCYNSFWAMTFLLLPAWIWAMAGYGKTVMTRIGNKILIIASSLPYIALLLIYGSRLDLGWNFIWYQIIALSIGMFTLPAFFLGTSTAAIGIRFLALQSKSRKLE